MAVDPKTQLEQRVKTLEHEVNTLRSGLKDVLLDIQEQLLLRYYPDLMADVDPSSENGDFEVGSKLAEDDAVHIKVSGASASTARKVTLNEIRVAPQGPSLASGDS